MGSTEAAIELFALGFCVVNIIILCRVMCYLSGVRMVLNRSVHAQLLDLCHACS